MQLGIQGTSGQQGGLVPSLAATTSVMSMQDRIKQHTVRKTIGFSGSTVFHLVMAETVLLSIAARILGVVSAMLALELSSLKLVRKRLHSPSLPP